MVTIGVVEGMLEAIAGKKACMVVEVKGFFESERLPRVSFFFSYNPHHTPLSNYSSTL